MATAREPHFLDFYTLPDLDSPLRCPGWRSALLPLPGHPLRSGRPPSALRRSLPRASTTSLFRGLPAPEPHSPTRDQALIPACHLPASHSCSRACLKCRGVALTQASRGLSSGLQQDRRRSAARVPFSLSDLAHTERSSALFLGAPQTMSGRVTKF